MAVPRDAVVLAGATSLLVAPLPDGAAPRDAVVVAGPPACRVAQEDVLIEPIGVLVGPVGAGLVSFPTKVAKNLLCFS